MLYLVMMFFLVLVLVIVPVILVVIVSVVMMMVVRIMFFLHWNKWQFYLNHFSRGSQVAAATTYLVTRLGTRLVVLG